MGTENTEGMHDSGERHIGKICGRRFLRFRGTMESRYKCYEVIEMQKEKVLQVLETFQDDVDLDSFLEKVYLMEKIEVGEKQIAAGEVVSYESAKQRLQKWLG